MNIILNMMVCICFVVSVMLGMVAATTKNDHEMSISSRRHRVVLTALFLCASIGLLIFGLKFQG